MSASEYSVYAEHWSGSLAGLSIIAELQTDLRTFNHCRAANGIADLQTDPRIFQSLQRCKQIPALFNLEHCAMQRQAGNRKMRWHLSAKAAFKMIEETAVFAPQGERCRIRRAVAKLTSRSS